MNSNEILQEATELQAFTQTVIAEL